MAVALDGPSPIFSPAAAPTAKVEADQKVMIDGGLYADVVKGLELNRETIKKAYKLAIGIFVAIAIVLGGAASAIALLTSVPFYYPAAVALVLQFCVGGGLKSTYRDIIRPSYAQMDTLFSELLAADNGKLNGTKIRVFTTYGDYCHYLDFGKNFEPGITLKDFLNDQSFTTPIERIKQALDGASENELLEKYVVSYLHPSLLKLKNVIITQEEQIRKVADSEACIKIIEDQISECAQGALSIHGKPVYTNNLVPSEMIQRLLKACPNLKVLDLEYCLDPETLKEVAAKKVPRVIFRRIHEIEEDVVNALKPIKLLEFIAPEPIREDIR